MNPTDQVEVVEDQSTETEQQGIELRLSDLDLVGGGTIGQTFM